MFYNTEAYNNIMVNVLHFPCNVYISVHVNKIIIHGDELMILSLT